MEILHLIDNIGDCKACFWYLLYVWIALSLYDQLQGLSLMVVDVGVVVVKFDGWSVGETNGWHSSQPSLNYDDDGVVTMVFWSVTKATIDS